MSERTENETTTTEPNDDRQAFAILGGGKIAYVKPIRSEDVHKLYPQAPELEPGICTCSHCMPRTARRSW